MKDPPVESFTWRALITKPPGRPQKSCLPSPLKSSLVTQPDMMGWPSMKYLASSLGTYWKLPLPSQRLFQRREVAQSSLCDRMNESWQPSLLKIGRASCRERVWYFG